MTCTTCCTLGRKTNKTKSRFPNSEKPLDQLKTPPGSHPSPLLPHTDLLAKTALFCSYFTHTLHQFLLYRKYNRSYGFGHSIRFLSLRITFLANQSAVKFSKLKHSPSVACDVMTNETSTSHTINVSRERGLFFWRICCVDVLCLILRVE